MRPRPLLLARALTLLLPLLGLLLLGGGVRADVFSIPARPTPPPPAAPPTLASALGALAPPKQDLFLAVGADKILPPPGATPASPEDRPGQVGEAYGLLARDFGGVMALAPPTMVVLNTRPGAPRPYDGLPAEEALKLLMAGLTPPQWAALTGEAGLGASDLADDAQRAYFGAVLPTGDVTATPQFTGGPLPAPVRMTASDLASARLRLGRRTQIDSPVEGHPDSGMGLLPTSIAGKALYTASSFGPPPAWGTVYGAVLRETRPNNPKDADLDYSAPVLKQSLSVDGLETVGDLVARVGRAAGLELYADRRYEGRRVTLVGRRTARAVDLLRATAFCLTGTFRRVGPAYVLTDDLQGTATRRQRLARFVREAQAARSAAVTAAEDSLAARGGVEALPWLGGLGFSEAQRALPQFNPFSAGSAVVPFALLTPAQQAFVLGYSRLDPSAGRPFTLRARPTLLLLSPAAPGPCTLDFLALDQIFEPSLQSMMKKSLQKVDAAQRASPFVMLADVPPAALKAALAALPRRAVLASPRTAAEVGEVVAAMKVLGLNQLWLDVFSGGHSHLETGVLAAALARAKGTGIAVVPALDLLRWGTDAPEDARDLTALGETSAQQEAWQERHIDHMNAINGRMVEVPHVPPTDLWACPAAPAVETTLRALVRRLAAMPGVTTLAVRGAVPPGYEHPPGSDDGEGDADLGYVPSLRLASLRRDHLDPVDLDLSYDATYALPKFDDLGAAGATPKDWGALKDGASRDLLRRLLASGQAAKRGSGGGAFRLLVQQRNTMGDSREGWYGLWENPQAPLPELPAATRWSVPLRQSAASDYAQVAHSQSRVALRAFPAWYTSSPYIVADSLRKLKPGWDGVVLDATGPEGLKGLGRLAGEK